MNEKQIFGTQFRFKKYRQLIPYPIKDIFYYTDYQVYYFYGIRYIKYLL